MQISNRPFGKTEKGELAHLYTLVNDSGATVKITNYGGIITEIHAPDKDNRPVNVVLGFEEMEAYYSEEYKNSKPYFGAIIGRYGNRIDKGRFSIDGKTYQIPCNLGEYSLHGGMIGFDQKVWQATTAKTTDSVSLELRYLSKHLEEGFPGNLSVKVSYTWNNKNELVIDYHASTDQSTHLNLTNHAYFNLNGCRQDVLDHIVRVPSEFYTEVDGNSIPTGRLQKVDGSCMDFRTASRIGERIDEVEGNGYDHNYVVNGYDGSLQLAAEAQDPSSGIKLEVLTTEPALQFYTANYLDGSISRGDTIFSKSMGFCFETQHYPDSPNQQGFPSTLLKPSEEFTSKTIYKFSTLND